MPAVGLAEMMLPSPVAVPPIVTPGVPLTSTPKVPLPRAAVPVSSVPMRLPRITTPGRGGPRDRHARLRVGRDHVARALRRAADGDARGIVDRHAGAGVGQRLGSGLVRADVVALDQGVRGAAADVDAVARVPGDHVASQSGRPADRGARPARDDDAGGQVAHRGRALDVGADQVARHDRSPPWTSR